MEHALVYALGIAVSPVAIATVLVILSSRRGSTNAVCFAAGWTGRWLYAHPVSVTGSLSLRRQPQGVRPQPWRSAVAWRSARESADQHGDRALFTVIGAASVVVPTVAYVTLPGHGAEPLAAFRGWLADHERTVLIVPAFAIGGLFLRDGLVLLMT